MTEIRRRHALKQWQKTNRKNADRPFEWWENRRKTPLLAEWDFDLCEERRKTPSQPEPKYHYGFTLAFWLTYFALLATVFR